MLVNQKLLNEANLLAVVSFLSGLQTKNVESDE